MKQIKKLLFFVTEDWYFCSHRLPLALAAKDAGYEVIYTGIRQTPESIVATAIQEDVDFVGLSLLSGAHNELFPRIVDLLKKQDAGDIVVFGGGVIPEEDLAFLEERGIQAIFRPGAPISEVISFIKSKTGSTAA